MQHTNPHIQQYISRTCHAITHCLKNLSKILLVVGIFYLRFYFYEIQYQVQEIITCTGNVQ